MAAAGNVSKEIAAVMDECILPIPSHILPPDVAAAASRYCKKAYPLNPVPPPRPNGSAVLGLEDTAFATYDELLDATAEVEGQRSLVDALRLLQCAAVAMCEAEKAVVAARGEDAVGAAVKKIHDASKLLASLPPAAKAEPLYDSLSQTAPKLLDQAVDALVAVHRKGSSWVTYSPSWLLHHLPDDLEWVHGLAPRFHKAQAAHVVADQRREVVKPFNSHVWQEMRSTEVEYPDCARGTGDVLQHSEAFPACKISRVAARLVQELYRMASARSDEAASALVNCVLLYPLVVMGNTKVRQLASLGLLGHNDCVFLAAHCGVLLIGGFEPADKLRDAQTKLMREGEAALQRVIDSQREEIISLLDTKGGLHQLGSRAGREEVSAAFHQVTTQLGDISRDWRATLPFPVYQVAFGALASSVISWLLRAVQGLEDIEEEACNMLVESLSYFQIMEGWFVEGRGDEDLEQAAEHMPEYRKFKELLFILSARMADIMAAYRAGDLADFTPKELVKLINALFAPSATRSANTRELQAAVHD